MRDLNVATYIKQLERENERLHSHHSECKLETGNLVELAQKWRIRSFVAEKLLEGLNNVAKWWYPEDLRKEIKIQHAHLFDAWKRRERWWIL